MVGNQVFLAAVTVAELRYGALVAGGQANRRTGDPGNHRDSRHDNLLTRVAELRFACRRAGHPLVDRTHASDLWVAASAIHIGAPLLTADEIFDNAPGLTLLD
jgi:predicted nucleic acid-binding protein